MSETGRIKLSRRRLWEQNPHCHWCGTETVLIDQDGGFFPHNAATVDHLRSRLDSSRSEPNPQREQRRVLACWRCNNERARDEQKSMPIEKLHERNLPQLNADAWCTTFVELQTRPELVEELKINPPLRSRLFYAFNVMLTIAAMRPDAVALHLLSIAADYHWRKLDEYRQSSNLEQTNRNAYNQLLSAFRNFRLNMQRCLTSPHQWRKITNPHYVLRSNTREKEASDA
jgi:hypothetical protein